MNHVFVLPESTRFREARFDFSKYMGGCIHPISDAVLKTLRTELTEGDRSICTLAAMAASAKRDLLPWLVTAAAAAGRCLVLEDINKGLLETFASDLAGSNRYTTANIKFTHSLMLIQSMSRLGYLATFAQIRPAVQFPGAQAAQVATRPYSKRERDALLRTLAEDFRDIRDGLHRDLNPESIGALAVGLLLLALPTGLNLTPLLELDRDALRSHPLRKNEWMLVVHKRRGNKELMVPAKWSDEIAAMRSLDLHLVPVYRQLVCWTQAHASAADRRHRHLVFIRPPLKKKGMTASGSGPVPLTDGDLRIAISRLNTRYAIMGDDGKPLRISTRRIRASLAARIYELSDGDPFVVARALGNLPKTTALHYLEPEIGAPAKFAQAVEEFAERLQRNQGATIEPTPVGGCSDPLHGRFAPKDGLTYCQRWLHCFQCPNQCVTGDESSLWRLYSFYWLLQEKSPALRRQRISGQVRFALHVIDTVVTERFGEAALKAKEAARVRPHPIWAGAKAMSLFFGEANHA